MRGALNGLRQGPNIHRKPMIDAALSKLMSSLDFSSCDMCTHRSSVSFAKSRIMRVIEHACGITGDNPLICDIRIIPSLEEPTHLLHYFNKSKTIQYGKRVRVVCVCNCPGPCVVPETSCLLLKREQMHPRSPSFWHSNGHEPTPRDTNNLITDSCKKCVLDPSEFRSHGLRSDGVVDLLTAGVADSIVRLLACWNNLDSMMPYKKFSAENVVKVMQDAKKPQ